MCMAGNSNVSLVSWTSVHNRLDICVDTWKKKRVACQHVRMWMFVCACDQYTSMSVFLRLRDKSMLRHVYKF